LSLAKEAQMAVKSKQGRPVFGVELKLLDEAGHVQRHDGQSMDELLVRGPWIVNGYLMMPTRARPRSKRTVGSTQAMSLVLRIKQVIHRRRS
jgi:acyl-CoA synthetase (AMP-forming)/AMP-acid ligase II